MLDRTKTETLQSEGLDDLLKRWHHWQASYTLARAFRGRALVCGEYSAGRHWDAANGVDDDQAEKRTMQAVDTEVQRLPMLHRLSISFEARALVLGVTVFVSPRLPADREERAKLLQEARAMLTRRLVYIGTL